MEGWGYVFSEVTINGYGGGHVIGTQGVESMKFETGLLDIGLSFISGSFLITAEQARFNDNINNVLSAMSSQGISSVYYVKRYLGGMSSPSAGGFLESYQHLFIDGATGNTIATFGTTW